MTTEEPIGLNFTDYFNVDPRALSEYGAFNISLVSDLPLFIDPFLLFNSKKPEYQELHRSIIKYLEFLRDKSVAGGVTESLLRSWYYFKEVKQNWFGFTVLGNDGHALAAEFARSLDNNLGILFSSSGEDVAASRHLEKLSLIRGGVGRDSISDFTTNLIKKFLLEYTQTFTIEHIAEADRERRRVPRVWFNYDTESWVEDTYTLPIANGDFVLLTPEDMLTRSETWINRKDLLDGFWAIPEAIPDDALRAQVSNYFKQRLTAKPNKKDVEAAAQQTIEAFPQILDYYVALKEMSGDTAVERSATRVSDAEQILVEQVRIVLADLLARTDILQKPVSSIEEAVTKVEAFKQYVEHNDGYKVINRKGEAFSNETEVQLFFGLVLVGSTFDVNREVNNGRGAVDFKLSKGAWDKSLIEFKLGSNSQLKRNLENQVEIYKQANQTPHAVKVIVNYTASDEERVRKILSELGIAVSKYVVVIDARSDNKPSASRA